eukprot:scaffold2423_cov113-Isochrysis_galbana.AAC.23
MPLPPKRQTGRVARADPCREHQAQCWRVQHRLLPRCPQCLERWQDATSPPARLTRKLPAPVLRLASHYPQRPAPALSVLPARTRLLPEPRFVQAPRSSERARPHTTLKERRRSARSSLRAHVHRKRRSCCAPRHLSPQGERLSRCAHRRTRPQPAGPPAPPVHNSPRRELRRRPVVGTNWGCRQVKSSRRDGWSEANSRQCRSHVREEPRRLCPTPSEHPARLVEQERLHAYQGGSSIPQTPPPPPCEAPPGMAHVVRAEAPAHCRRSQPSQPRPTSQPPARPPPHGGAAPHAAAAPCRQSPEPGLRCSAGDSHPRTGPRTGTDAPPRLLADAAAAPSASQVVWTARALAPPWPATRHTPPAPRYRHASAAGRGAAPLHGSSLHARSRAQSPAQSADQPRADRPCQFAPRCGLGRRRAARQPCLCRPSNHLRGRARHREWCRRRHQALRSPHRHALDSSGASIRAPVPVGAAPRTPRAPRPPHAPEPRGPLPWPRVRPLETRPILWRVPPPRAPPRAPPPPLPAEKWLRRPPPPPATSQPPCAEGNAAARRALPPEREPLPAAPPPRV